jgi:hypothetical protein
MRSITIAEKLLRTAIFMGIRYTHVLEPKLNQRYQTFVELKRKAGCRFPMHCPEKR